MQTAIMARDATTEAYPLAAMQRGMLVHGLLDSRDGVYVQQLVVTLRESFRVPLFRAAWQRLVDRHDVLRTSFCLDDLDEPVQRVHESIDCDLDECDWRQAGIHEGEQRLAAYLRDDRLRGFALDDPPLWRLSLFRLGEDDYRLVWTSHHALLDGRSRLLLLEELFAFYDASIRGTIPWLEPPRPYRDHIRELTDRDFAFSQGYWKEYLRGFQLATPLPEQMERTIPDDEDGHRTLEVRLTKELTLALCQVAHEFDITLNTILQGAWGLLLFLYSGTDDVVFGATRACRQSSVEGAESMVGLFINTLPVRARIQGSASVAAWLQDLRSRWVAMRDHEQAPLAMVQGWSEVPHGEPLFESIVVFEKLPLNESLTRQTDAWAGREFRLLGTTNYPLVVAGFGGASLLIELTYDRRRFADLAIERLGDRLRSLLEAIAANPRQTLTELAMISPREKRQLIDWNDTATVIPRDASVAQLFEAQAARTPAAVALVFGHQQWTYEELNVRANRLAHRLRGMGVGFEAPVAICADRSPEMVAGLLAILKAGGVYVPLDPTYPSERLGFILRDTQASVVLTQQSLASDLPSHGAQVLFLDPDAEELDRGEHDGNPLCPATFDSLAYIMYTSGSTGSPKGVAVPHRGIIRLLFGIDYVQLDSSRKILHLASPAFDASTFELWGPLLHGGQCVLFQGRVPALDVLERVLRESKVDTLWLTAGLFHTVVDECVEILAGVEQLLVGGEAPSVPHVRRALECLPETVIINLYGPTETTTFATSYRIPRDIPADAGSVPIGKPIGNTSVYLFDTLGRLVPVGVPGELHIGGPGVARGYWNQPELTARRFLPDQFDKLPGAHLYRTGDLARRLPDGNIEFLGRLDGQVKVRGFRIETGEIETVLRRHEGVRDAVVVAAADSGGVGRRLIAYVVVRLEPGHAPVVTVEALRDFLGKILPEYMVPAAIVLIDKLPLSPTGKVDRRRLPAPGSSRIEGRQATAASTPIETCLAGIFANLLGCDQVDVHDDFFRQGGNSLLAIQAVSRARKALGVDLPLVSLFEKPTVAKLAEFVADLVRTGTRSDSPPLVHSSCSKALPTLCSQLSVWDIYNRHRGKILLNTSRAIRFRGPLHVPALRQALGTLIERHEALRTNFAIIDGSPAQIVNAATPSQLPVVDLGSFPEAGRMAQAQRHFDDETRHRYDLATDGMLRPTLLRLNEQDHVLVLIFSHIVMDGWSLDIFNRELSILYEALSTGKRPDLPSIPLRPADVACWEQRLFRSPAGLRQIEYWRNRLEDAPLAPVIPGDGTDPEPGDFRSRRQALMIPRPLVEALRELGRQQGCTLPMTMFAALNVMLHELTGQEDILVGIPLAARARPEVDGLIACFRKRMILRTDLSGGPTFRTLLGRVREVAAGAYLHLDVSQEIVFPDRGVDHPAHWSRVPMNYNFIDSAAGSLKLRGLATTVLQRSEQYDWVALSMDLFQDHNGILVELITRRTLYSPAMADELLTMYRSVLQRVVFAPNQRLSAILNERQNGICTTANGG
jgi:amino acid adenylation domain-containing protein